MRTLSFELTMPNRGSWDGKWTGESNRHIIIRKVSDRYLNKQDHLKTLLEKGQDSWHYSWRDGWGANVTVKIIDGTETRKLRKISDGFCGYDWMIDSILHYGIIMNSAERKRLLTTV
jgi:hypothetical protein